MALCSSCQNLNLVPDFAALPSDCSEHGSRYFERSYGITQGQLKKAAANRCPWCQAVITVLKGCISIERDDEDDTWFKVFKVYSCRSYPHTEHFDRFEYGAWYWSTANRWSQTPLYKNFLFNGRLKFCKHVSNESEQSSYDMQAMIDHSQRWITACLQSHESCGSNVMPALPTRLLDLQADATSAGVRLHVPASGATGQYAALSYCWGGSYNLRTTSENLTTHMDFIPDSDLPLTVLDAVRFVRQLGIRYLWIDALCIVQDSPLDKRREIRNMRNIFKNSFITLIASHARTVRAGFLRPETRPGSTYFEAQCQTDRFATSRVRVELMKFYNPDTQPVNSRAWTLEERILPTRLLIFSSYGLMWNCQEKEATMDEDVKGWKRGNDRVPIWNMSRPVERSEQLAETALSSWFRLVEDYSTRSLTHLQDKMPAIASLAEEFHVLWGDILGDYAAGIWRRFLVEGLAWSRKWSRAAPESNQYWAPSWSWAKVDDAVDMQYLYSLKYDSYTCHATVSDLEVSTMPGAGPFGSIESGSLTPNALTMQAKWLPDLADSSTEEISGTFENQSRLESKVMPDAGGIFDSDLPEVRVILLSHVSNRGSGIVATPIDTDRYRRVGAVEYLPLDAFRLTAAIRATTLV